MTTRRIENLLKSVNNRLQSMLDFDGFYAALYDPLRLLVEFPVVVLDGQPQEWITRPYQAALWLLDSIIDTRAYQLIEQDFEREVGKIGLKYWPHWFSVSVDCVEELDRREISAGLRAQFKNHSRELASEVLVEAILAGNAWTVVDGNQKYSIRNEGQTLNVYRLPQSWLAVPMIVEDQVIGILVIENRHRSKSFGDNGVRILSTVARQTAVAIENARLVDQRDRKIAALKALYEMGQKLNSGIRSDESEIVKLIHNQASKLMDTSNMYIALYDEAIDMVRFPLMYEDGQRVEMPSRKGGAGRTEWIIRTRESILIETRVKSEAWYKEPARTEYKGQAYSSWVGVPMFAGDKVLGVIATYHKIQDYAYSEEDLEVLTLMANQAAVAIENARLYSNLQKRNEQLADLQKLGVKITSQLNLDTTLGSVAEQANMLLSADFSTLFPYNPEQKKFEKGIRKGKIEIEPSIPSSKGYSSRIAQSQQAIFSEDAEDGPGIKPVFLENKKVKSFAGVPLVVNGKAVGVLYVNYLEHHSFTKEEQDVIGLLANQAAVAIENTTLRERLVDAEKILVMDRFATDFIHRVNNLVGTIPIWTQQVQARLRSLDLNDEQIFDYLSNIILDVRQVKDITAQLIETTRQRPNREICNIVELVQATARAIRVTTPDEISTVEKYPPEPAWVSAVLVELETTLWDIAWNGVQAITPVGSGTLTLEVKLVAALDLGDMSKVRVEIRDDGIGVPQWQQVFTSLSSTKGGMGYGLWRAKKVIDELGGTIDFKSVPGNTVFWFELPEVPKEETHAGEK